MRRGVSYICNRCRKASNKYLKSYDLKTNQNILYTQKQIIYMANFSTSGFKWIDQKKIDLNKQTRSSSKRCVPEVGLEYPTGLRELQNDYPVAPDKIEIKREMFSESQLKISDLYIIPIGNFKKLGPNFFDKEIYETDYENLQLYLRLGLKLKKIHRPLEFNQSQWLKQYVEFNTQKRNGAEQIVTNMEKHCTN